jgi:hypothetical protein
MINCGKEMGPLFGSRDPIEPLATGRWTIRAAGVAFFESVGNAGDAALIRKLRAGGALGKLPQ